MVSTRKLMLLIGALLPKSIFALDVDWTNRDSIKAAARNTADGMMSYYHGNESGQIPGLLPGPYYWWEAGAMFGALINYWHFTGDTTYNAVVTQAMQFQIGEHEDYNPQNQSLSMGNDDQAFWAISALQAAEYNFPDSTAPGSPSWLSLAQAVFNEQVLRWDNTTCAGGLPWQVYRTNTGYDLKNTISNGCFFQIAARLARYTGDPMYAQWAETAWDWMFRIGLINPQYGVFDNSEATRLNCTQLGREQWTYNAGTILMGASMMFNYTNGDPTWKMRTQRLLDNAALSFFQPTYNGVMVEICEQAGVCNYDQKSFKAYLSRWLTVTTQMAPFTLPTIQPLLLTSAKAAAEQCSGALRGGTACGIKWWLNGTWDGTDGVGQQMSALETILGTLVDGATPPVTKDTGGTSVSNPTAGYNGSTSILGLPSPATKGGRVGAWITTVLLVITVCGVWAFMSSEALEYKYGPGAPTVGGLRGKRSRVWKGSSGDLNSIMMGPSGPDRQSRGADSFMLGHGNRESRGADSIRPDSYVSAAGAESRTSTLVKKKSTLSTAVPQNESDHDRIQSISSVLRPVSEIHAANSPMMERFSRVPDRRSTPIYKGGDLLT